MDALQEERLKAVIADMRAEIDGLKAQPKPQFMQPAQTNASQPIQDVTALVQLMNTITAAIPKPPSLSERMAELRQMMELAGEFNPSGGFSEDGEGNPLRDIAALLAAMPKPPTTPETPTTPVKLNSVPLMNPNNLQNEKIEMPQPMPQTPSFKHYADEMIPALSAAEIHAIKLAPKILIKQKLQEEIKKNHPDMTMSDDDFEYAYRKVLSL